MVLVHRKPNRFALVAGLFGLVQTLTDIAHMPSPLISSLIHLSPAHIAQAFRQSNNVPLVVVCYARRCFLARDTEGLRGVLACSWLSLVCGKRSMSKKASGVFPAAR